MKKTGVLAHIIVFTNTRDVHADIIIPRLQNLGASVFRFNNDQLQSVLCVSLAIDNNNINVAFNNDGGTISTLTYSHIDTAWIRRPFEFTDSPKEIQAKLKRQEIISSISQLIHLLPEKTRVIDKPSHVDVAREKIYQLQVATTIGLPIPNTLITNSPEKAVTFFKTMKGHVVTKAIREGFARIGEDAIGIFTTKVRKDMDFSLVRNCPTLFQEEIEKKSDIRITVIGRKVFAVEIESQQIPEVSLDWRKGSFIMEKIPHHVIELPNPLKNKLFSLLDYFGLHFGAIDMAKTPDGDYVFFELNPSGQFLWLEDITGLPLAEEMTKFLLGIH